MSDLSEIEAQIEEERLALARTLDGLTNSLAPDAIANKLTSSVEGYGGEFGRQAWDSAKQNPAAFALVATGLGLLVSGTGAPTRKTTKDTANDPMAAMVGFDDRVAKADAAMKAEMATESAVPRASWLRENLNAGLDSLPNPARARVIKLRKAAIVAQERVEARAADIARKSRSFHNDQPLAVGALALGLGALIGSLLPSTRQEDELLGKHRDNMMNSARDALEMEMAKLSHSAKQGVEAAFSSQPSTRSSRRTRVR